MRDGRRWPSGFAATALMLFATLTAGEVAAVGMVCADDAVAPVAEEALEDEDVAAAPVDAERLERTDEEMKADEADQAPEAVGWVQIGRQPGLQQFMPLLKRALTVEIHYLRKICNPSPEEVAAIRKASEAELPKLAKELNGGRNRGLMVDGKSTREKLIEVVESAAEKALPAEQARRYRDELKARADARLRGAAEMMTVHVDRRLAFSNEQYDRVPEILLEHWKSRWSRNLQPFTYGEYCPLPDAATLDSVLTDQQKKIWRSRGRDSRIGFGWESDVGFGQLGGATELKELDDYSGAGEK